MRGKIMILALIASLTTTAVGLGLLSKKANATNSPAGSYEGTPDDFMQISQLFSRYNYTIDNGDGVAWADTFTPDGVFQDPSTCAMGREQLINVVGRTPTIGKDQKMHHVPELGPIVYSDRDHATVHSTVMVVGETAYGSKDGGIMITGTYDDTLVRLKGKWVFSYRLVHRPANAPDVPCPAANRPGSSSKGK